MLALVVNCGSSSIKADVLDPETGSRAATMLIERIGKSGVCSTLDRTDPVALGDGLDHAAALGSELPRLLAQAGGASKIGTVGHRVVHGGERFGHPTRLDDEVVDAIEKLIELAPLHLPANLAGIRAAREHLPDVLHVAVFDTGFHRTLPRRARTYAIPTELAERHGIRRYGFHGPSHAYVSRRAAAHLGEDVESLRIITCHLGNGASLAAVEYGRSVETSMGLTPLEGLVMGTRSGDIDAGAVLHLMRREGLDIDAVDTLLNQQSGLAGLSGVGNDLRDIEARAAEGDDRCRLAVAVFAHRVRKYIGAYAAVMGGVDAIVFTGGIGENSARMRHRIAQRLEFLGARLDEDLNRDARVDASRPVAEVSEPHARARLLVVATDESHEIARQAARLAAEGDRVNEGRTIPIAVSARHIHLTQPMVEALFGPGRELTPRSDLSQPGQFACEETLTVIGPKRSIEGVRVLGPTRSRNQIEISRTDEFHLGVDAPVRRSGDVANSPGITLEGPAGRVTLREGLICAARHIHMTPADAEDFGVVDGDIVEIAIDSAGRDLIYGDVLVRVSEAYRLEMHVDTDEANAAELSRTAEGMLVGTTASARLRRRVAG
jgi:acetate kinase